VETALSVEKCFLKDFFALFHPQGPKPAINNYPEFPKEMNQLKLGSFQPIPHITLVATHAMML
jgi:hypothetical protein